MSVSTATKLQPSIQHLYNFPPKRKFPSLRNYLNEHIESRELNVPVLVKIVPVSLTNRRSDTEKYSSSRHKLAPPIPPGVSPINTVEEEILIQNLR